MVALYFMFYNFCRAHKTLRVTPAMEAGLSDHVWDIEELVSLVPEQKSAKRALTRREFQTESRSSGVSEVIYNRKAAIRNAVIYAVAFVFSLIGLVTRSSWFGYVLMSVAVLWAVGGLTYNLKAIRHGFVDLDNPNSN
jgi:hypothetical protein